MSNYDDCVGRIKRCSEWGEKKREECLEERDEGYNRCDEERDEGYRDCCDWAPCSWVCDAWTWVSNIVCVAWTWVSNVVCVVWHTIGERFCQVWTFVTFPFCLISPKVAGIVDGVIQTIVEIVDGIIGVVKVVVEGTIGAIRHPIDTVATLIEYSRGCPDKEGHPVGEMFVIAHHGLTSLYPENTAQSCRAAVKAGADAVEVDLCMTSDNQAILWHDYDPDDPVSLARQNKIPSGSAFYPDVPGIGSRWRRPTTELTLAEFREHYTYKSGKAKADTIIDDYALGERDLTIPTLQEFTYTGLLAEIRLLCLDVKLPAGAVKFASPLTDRIHAALPAERHYDVVVMAPSIRVLKAMKDHSDEQAYGLTFTWDVEFPVGPILNPLRFSAIDHAINKDLHNRAASVGRPVGPFFPWKTYKRTLGYDITRWNDVNSDPEANNAGTRIDHLIAWTVNDEDELRCLIKLKVSGIITDEPRRLAGLLGR
jgi:glycerophosphoryl diester phosphodiesterase